MFGTQVGRRAFQGAGLMQSGSFSTSEVLRLSGATARQLQWWDEHSLVVPARDGRKRLYSSSDLADILVILEFRRRHISLQQVRRVLRFLRQQLNVRLADLVSEESEHPLPDYHLLIDGDRLYLETDARQIFDILKNTDQAVFLISLSAAAKKLQVAGLTFSAIEYQSEKKPSKGHRRSISTKQEKEEGRGTAIAS
jgi:DNA-binding transcriptional MerR regulator